MTFSHLFFADDLVLFEKADNVNCSTIRDVLDSFCARSGQSISLKPVHSREKPVQGLARAVELHMGDWKGKVTLATTDDFQVVLGIDFLRQVKDSKPHMNSLCIIEEKTPACFLWYKDQEDQGHAISQKAKKGFQKKCPHPH